MPESLRILTTADGSHTLEMPGSDVTYHSRHGAIQEAMHVFVNTGFFAVQQYFKTPELRIFEMGFGTGLNAFLTASMAAQLKRKLRYHSIDLYPLPDEKRCLLNYGALVKQKQLWDAIGNCPWDEWCAAWPCFSLKKEKADLLTCKLEDRYHLIYFDAFAPDVSPGLWAEAVFEKLFAHTLPGGILVTYCSKSSVRKALKTAGWKVEKLPGPPGKREIVRALKVE